METRITVAIASALLLLFLSAALAFYFIFKRIAPINSGSAIQADSLQLVESLRFGIISAFQALHNDDNDFRTTIDLAESDNFTEHSPVLFERVRDIIHYSRDELMDALSRPLIAKTSAGRSESIFLYTQCNRFILKTTRGSEAKNLDDFLPQYYDHLSLNPNSILPRYLGLYSIDNLRSDDHNFAPGRHSFILMNNWFDTDLLPLLKFDFKGSWVGRQTMPLDQDLIDLVDDEKFHSHRLGQLPATDDLDHSTLKEHDFQSLLDIGCQGLVQLGCHKKAFMDQLNIDLLLLEQNNFMDYSLLLGIFKGPNGRESFYAPTILLYSDSSIVNIPVPARGEFHNFHGGVQSDGDNDEVYFFGMVDALQKFNMKKWAEKALKRSKSKLMPSTLLPLRKVTSQTSLLRENMDEFSVEGISYITSEPVRYGRRLAKFVDQYTI